MTTEHAIDLDRVHRALRSGNRWAVQKRQPDGTWDTLKAWAGGRRSLFQFLEQNRIAPTREAERLLDLLPESDGFRD